jgi:hypothetical protein
MSTDTSPMEAAQDKARALVKQTGRPHRVVALARPGLSPEWLVEPFGTRAFPLRSPYAVLWSTHYPEEAAE